MVVAGRFLFADGPRRFRRWAIIRIERNLKPRRGSYGRAIGRQSTLYRIPSIGSYLAIRLPLIVPSSIFTTNG